MAVSRRTEAYQRHGSTTSTSGPVSCSQRAREAAKRRICRVAVVSYTRRQLASASGRRGADIDTVTALYRRQQTIAVAPARLQVHLRPSVYLPQQQARRDAVRTPLGRR